MAFAWIFFGIFLFFSRGSVEHIIYYQSLDREGCWGTTDDFATSFLHFSLFSTAVWELPNSRPVHSLMLSSHLFVCLPCLLPPFTVPCKMVWARPDEQETWPYHCSLHLFTIIRRSSWSWSLTGISTLTHPLQHISGKDHDRRLRGSWKHCQH